MWFSLTASKSTLGSKISVQSIFDLPSWVVQFTLDIGLCLVSTIHLTAILRMRKRVTSLRVRSTVAFVFGPSTQVGFVLLFVFAPRKRKSSASSHRAPTPPSVLPSEPSPEDEAADGSSGTANAGVSESKKSDTKKVEGEEGSATEKDDGDTSAPAAPPAEAVVRAKG